MIKAHHSIEFKALEAYFCYSIYTLKVPGGQIPTFFGLTRPRDIILIMTLNFQQTKSIDKSAQRGNYSLAQVDMKQGTKCRHISHDHCKH